MGLRCVIADDTPGFLDVARAVLERGGIDVVGLASTPAEALDQATAFRPDVVIVDVGLSGFELALRLAAQTDPQSVNVILISMQDAEELAEPVAVSPVLGFLSKLDLSAEAIRDLLADRAHGHGCRHEALVYFTPGELVAGTAPFVRHGLAADEPVLVVMTHAASAPLREALGEEAARVEFVDAVEWHRTDAGSTGRAFVRYAQDRLARGASRVRIVGEPEWQTMSPAAVAGWKCFEAEVGIDMASLPVSFVCPYDALQLPADIVAGALRMHPLERSGHGTRPSRRYAEARSDRVGSSLAV